MNFMSRFFNRIVVLMLVPCLLMDPALAAALFRQQPIVGRSVVEINPEFKEQALSLEPSSIPRKLFGVPDAACRVWRFICNSLPTPDFATLGMNGGSGGWRKYSTGDKPMVYWNDLAEKNRWEFLATAPDWAIRRFYDDFSDDSKPLLVAIFTARQKKALFRDAASFAKAWLGRSSVTENEQNTIDRILAYRPMSARQADSVVEAMQDPQIRKRFAIAVHVFNERRTIDRTRYEAICLELKDPAPKQGFDEMLARGLIYRGRRASDGVLEYKFTVAGNTYARALLESWKAAAANPMRRQVEAVPQEDERSTVAVAQKLLGMPTHTFFAAAREASGPRIIYTNAYFVGKSRHVVIMLRQFSSPRSLAGYLIFAEKKNGERVIIRAEDSKAKVRWPPPVMKVVNTYKTSETEEGLFNSAFGNDLTAYARAWEFDEQTEEARAQSRALNELQLFVSLLHPKDQPPIDRGMLRDALVQLGIRTRKEADALFAKSRNRDPLRQGAPKSVNPKKLLSAAFVGIGTGILTYLLARWFGSGTPTPPPALPGMAMILFNSPVLLPLALGTAAAGAATLLILGLKIPEVTLPSGPGALIFRLKNNEVPPEQESALARQIYEHRSRLKPVDLESLTRMLATHRFQRETAKEWLILAFQRGWGSLTGRELTDLRAPLDRAATEGKLTEAQRLALLRPLLASINVPPGREVEYTALGARWGSSLSQGDRLLSVRMAVKSLQTEWQAGFVTMEAVAERLGIDQKALAKFMVTEMKLSPLAFSILPAGYSDEALRVVTHAMRQSPHEVLYRADLEVILGSPRGELRAWAEGMAPPNITPDRYLADLYGVFSKTASVTTQAPRRRWAAAYLTENGMPSSARDMKKAMRLLKTPKTAPAFELQWNAKTGGYAAVKPAKEPSILEPSAIVRWRVARWLRSLSAQSGIPLHQLGEGEYEKALINVEEKQRTLNSFYESMKTINTSGWTTPYLILQRFGILPIVKPLKEIQTIEDFVPVLCSGAVKKIPWEKLSDSLKKELVETLARQLDKDPVWLIEEDYATPLKLKGLPPNVSFDLNELFCFYRRQRKELDAAHEKQHTSVFIAQSLGFIPNDRIINHPAETLKTREELTTVLAKGWLWDVPWEHLNEDIHRTLVVELAQAVGVVIDDLIKERYEDTPMPHLTLRVRTTGEIKISKMLGLYEYYHRLNATDIKTPQFIIWKLWPPGSGLVPAGPPGPGFAAMGRSDGDVSQALLPVSPDGTSRNRGERGQIRIRTLLLPTSIVLFVGGIALRVFGNSGIFLRESADVVAATGMILFVVLGAPMMLREGRDIWRAFTELWKKRPDLARPFVWQLIRLVSVAIIGVWLMAYVTAASLIVRLWTEPFSPELALGFMIGIVVMTVAYGIHILGHYLFGKLAGADIFLHARPPYMTIRRASLGERLLIVLGGPAMNVGIGSLALFAVKFVFASTHGPLSLAATINELTIWNLTMGLGALLPLSKHAGGWLAARLFKQWLSQRHANQRRNGQPSAAHGGVPPRAARGSA